MKSRLIGIACILLLQMTLVGCANNVIPDMTQEQESQIATYASDSVLKYCSSNGSRLVDSDAEALRRAEIAERAAKVQELIEQNKALEESAREEAKEQLENTEVIGEDGQAEKPKSHSVTEMSEALGTGQFFVNYAGYDIVNAYSDSQDDEWSPMIEATEGKKLLVIKLDVTNNGDTAVFDVIDRRAMFYISSESGQSGMAMATMMLNDFANAKDEIESNSTKRYALLMEVDDSVSAVYGISLMMKVDGETITYALD